MTTFDETFESMPVWSGSGEPLLDRKEEAQRVWDAAFDAGKQRGRQEAVEQLRSGSVEMPTPPHGITF